MLDRGLVGRGVVAVSNLPSYYKAVMRIDWVNQNVPIARVLEHFKISTASSRMDCIMCGEERAKLHHDRLFCFECNRPWFAVDIWSFLEDIKPGKAAVAILEEFKLNPDLTPDPTEDEVKRHRRTLLAWELWAWLSGAFPEWNPPLQAGEGWTIEHPIYIPWESLTEEPSYGTRGALSEDYAASRYYTDKVLGSLRLVHTNEDGQLWLEKTKAAMARYIERRRNAAPQ